MRFRSALFSAGSGLGWLYWLVLTGLPLVGRAEAPAEAWFQPPALTQPALAPDGRSVAALRWSASGRELVVSTANAPVAWTLIPAPEPGRSVADFVWLSDGELAFLTLAADGTGKFWRARTDGSAPTPLLADTSAQPALIRFLRPQPAVPGRVLIEGVLRSELRRGQTARWMDVFVVELASGKVTRVARNPGDVGQWLADGSGTVRVALAMRRGLQELRAYNPAAGGTWRTVSTFEFVRDPAALVGVSRDGNHAWISARLGHDTTGVQEFDVVAGRFTRTLWRDYEFDFAGALFLGALAPIAVSFDALKPGTSWFEPGWAERIRPLAAVEPNVVWQPASFSRDGETAILSAISDREPPRFALMKRDSADAPVWLTAAEIVRPPVTAPMQPMRFTGRDRAALTGYLTRPGMVTGPGPLLVLAHGGPWARDSWGWHPEVQFLASRGWAVLQVNYRGSAGFGRSFQEAGAGRWGTLAVNDLADGAHWAVAKGVADPARIVVAGASFGGWLTLAALEREPELFQAGASVAGVFDLSAWLRYATTREVPFVAAAQQTWLFGVARDSWQPLTSLSELRRPLLLVHATDDRSVPAEQSVAVARALRESGKVVEFLELPHGGHTLDSPVVQAETWTRIAEFLRRELPPVRR